MRYVKLAQKEKATWGVLKGDTVCLISGTPYEGICETGERIPLSACKLLAPCTPSKIVCVGKNYYDHAMEMGEGVPDHPILFLKGPNTLNCPEGEIHAPAFVTRLDYEGELAFVIKRRAKNVSPKDFSTYVLGYTCLNDVTARDIQKGDGQWTRGKSMDGFAPVGPILTDEVDGTHLSIRTRLNGVEVQASCTSMLITKLPELLSFITASMTLEPGDVVATGTPAGIGPMVCGDVVEVEIEGIGTLRNHIV